MATDNDHTHDHDYVAVFGAVLFLFVSGRASRDVTEVRVFVCEPMSVAVVCGNFRLCFDTGCLSGLSIEISLTSWLAFLVSWPLHLGRLFRCCRRRCTTRHHGRVEFGDERERALRRAAAHEWGEWPRDWRPPCRAEVRIFD